MKKVFLPLCAGILLSACSMPAPVVQADQMMKDVSMNYIRLQDAFYLRPGMEYSEVKSILKQDPYELYQNIEDNCIIVSYHSRRNMRVHSSTQSPVPMAYYTSEDPTNLTYDGDIPFYIILDGETKVVRSFFSEPDREKVERYSRMLRRAKKVCENPDKVDSFLNDWFDGNPSAEQSDKILRIGKLSSLIKS
ncbi:MAG: hypothetical protein P8N56_05365 [Schleiferiaceae bacterium]|nr:hypothetical protein [Schleiferiaceae bacterium]